MWELRGCCAPRFAFSSKTGSASSCRDGLLRLPPSPDVCLRLLPWEITSHLTDSHSHQKARKKQMQSYNKRGSNNHGRKLKLNKNHRFPFLFLAFQKFHAELMARKCSLKKMTTDCICQIKPGDAHIWLVAICNWRTLSWLIATQEGLQEAAILISVQKKTQEVLRECSRELVALFCPTQQPV